jgi:hypothetical protein
MANKKINQLVSKTAILSTDIFGIGDATTGQLFKKTIAELQAAIGGAVISVNGLVGTVVLDTDDVQELASPTNKYFTDARARAAISLTVTGNSGASTYSSGTGVLNVPTYTLAGLGGITASFLSGTSGISYNSTTGVISYSGTVYTDASIRALFSGSTGITYNSSTGAISYSGTVYTDSSVRALISLTTTGTSGASTYNNTTGVINVPDYTLAGLGGISLTSLSGGTGITYNNTTGAISYSGTVYTDASVRALISASGAVSYNNTTGVISLTNGNLTEATSSVLTITGGTGAVLGSGTSIQVKQASSSVSGFLSSTDWSTFNGKASALSGTTNYVAKFTSSTGIGNSLIFDNATNVGINTATPTAKLEIYDNSNSGILRLSRDAGGQRGALEFGRNNGGSFQTCGSIIVDSDIASVNSGLMYFYTSNSSGTNTERMRITSTGNVGIGTTSPDQQLTIGGYTDIQMTLRSSTTTGSGEIYFGDSDSVNRGFIGYRHNGDYMQFNTAGSERMRITSAGTVQIGIVAHFGTITDASNYILINQGQIGRVGNGLMYINASYSGNVSICEGGGNVLLGTSTNNGERLYVSGSIRATGSITANSDISLKKNLLKIENALEKVEQINGYTYEFKEDDSKRHAGVIAQEIQTVLPEIVNKGNDGILGVEYGNISALLIEAIKEQNTKIKNLETLLASK